MLLQVAPHSAGGGCDAGWKKVARQVYAAVLEHCLLVNPSMLLRRTHLSDCKTCYENGGESRAAYRDPCPVEAQEPAEE